MSLLFLCALARFLQLFLLGELDLQRFLLLFFNFALDLIALPLECGLTLDGRFFQFLLHLLLLYGVFFGFGSDLLLFLPSEHRISFSKLLLAPRYLLQLLCLKLLGLGLSVRKLLLEEFILGSDLGLALLLTFLLLLHDHRLLGLVASHVALRQILCLLARPGLQLGISRL